jgi:hypothetical protein
VFNYTVSTFNDATTSMFHRSVGGYHGAKMGRYQDIIDYYFSGQERDFLPVLNMLNTKYIIVPDEESNKPTKIENPNRLGAAWFVQNIEKKSSPKEVLESLEKVDLKNTALVESDAPTPKIEGQGTIELVKYRPNKLRYNYTLTGGPSVAVFSEIYYDKGWQAYIDGKPAESFRADYLLRAMVLPEGEHTVEWRFEAPNWTATSAITLICSILIILALITIVTIKCYGYYYEKKEII